MAQQNSRFGCKLRRSNRREPRMRNGITKSALLLAVTLAAACGSSAADDAMKFVGSWTFASGSVAATCSSGLPGGTFPLAGLTVMITRVDNSHIRIEANTSCIVNFSVSGATASVAAGQTCTLPTPTLGPQQIDITTWTLALASGSIDAAITGTAIGGLCTASGTGVLVPAAGDGGTSDAADGG